MKVPAPHVFGESVAAFDASLGELARGVDRMGPATAAMCKAAESTGDELVREAAAWLREIEVDRLIAHDFVRHARSYLDVFRYPEPRSGPPAPDPALATDALRWGPGAAADGYSLYVDIPFCETACAFCTTAGKNTGADRAPVLAYLAHLERELALLAARFSGGMPAMRCLYIGGGTGSYLRIDELDRLLASIDRHFGLPAGIPMTLEGSPSTMDAAKAHALLARGFNAVSLGVESFEDHLLRDCRRAHDAAGAKSRIRAVTDAGIGHVNIDLIAGLPGQTLLDFCRTLNTVAELRPGAVTFYPLRLHRKTSYWARKDDEFPAVTVVYLMQALGRRFLARLGYQPSQNNRYVLNASYRQAQSVFTRSGGFDLGVGTRAQSQIEGICWRNSHIRRDYLRALGAGHLPITHLMRVTPLQHRLKHFLLPLKLQTGLDSATFAARCAVSVEEAFGPILERLVAEKLVSPRPGGYRMTPAGELFETEALRWAERTVRAAQDVPH